MPHAEIHLDLYTPSMAEYEELLCARCARHQETCCQNVEVFVTLGDVQRIEQTTGRCDFYEFRRPGHAVYANQQDDPIWCAHVFRSDGTRRVLRQQPNGDCTFLGPAGCVLPLGARPLVCRLYPYDYTSAGIHTRLARGCPVELLRPGQSLLAALNMNLEEARGWHRQLYHEIQLEAGSVSEVASCTSV